jgi:hypothetical protein
VAKGPSSLQMGISTLVLTSKESLTDTENTFGPMETHTKANLWKAQGKARAHSVKQMDRCMKDSSKMIQSMGRVYRNTNRGSNSLGNSSRASDLRAS